MWYKMSEMSGQNISSLRELPGIGEKVAERFIEAFGSEEEALKAIYGGDVNSISEVRGVSHPFALSLVRDTQARTRGCFLSDFLKTKEAEALYSRLLELIKGFSHTSSTRDSLDLFYPYPASRPDLLTERRNFVNKYLKLGKSFSENAEFLALLSRVRKLKPAPEKLKVGDRVILVRDPKIYETLKKRYQMSLSVQLAESFAEFVDLAKGYSHVIVFDDAYLSFDLPEGIEPEFFPDPEKIELWKILPEKELAFFARNLDCINACLKLLSLLRAQNFNLFEELSDENLESLASALSRLGEDGSQKEGFDPELDRLENALEQLDTEIASALKEANQRITVALEASSLTLTGKDLLKLVSGGMEVRDLLAKEVYKIYKGEIESVKVEIAESLDLNKKEKFELDSLFSGEFSYPLAADNCQLQLLRQKLFLNLEKIKLTRKRELAQTLSSFHLPVEKLVREILDFDVGFSIACFAEKFNLKMPDFTQDAGIGIVDGENLFLKARYGKVEPVSYSVGKTDFSPKGEENRVVLLSGVNSGGKTSLLELLAQCVILGYMGFPTPARELELGPVEEFYYFGKSKGTLDAGAFETTLKQFSVLSRASGKLVLADELESITEPGASARIIAGILEYMAGSEKSLGVFVSHLSELILKNTDADAEIRVDGIEAKGLDSNLELIVDRNPVYNHVAKSTPELIVERLLRKTSGEEKEFYAHLKAKFKK